MNKDRLTAGLLAVMAATALGIGGAGCASTGGKLTVGTVDTVALVQSDPEYQQTAVSYTQERAKLLETNQKLVPTGKLTDVDPATYAKIRTSHEALDKKWFDKTQEYLKKRNDAIRAASEQVCKEKGIDLVLVDTPENPTVEYGAVNITPDVELKLQKSGASAPAGEKRP